MGVAENAAGVVIVSGWLLFVVMKLWSVRLVYTMYAQWQLISAETEEELRRQGMPYLDGLDDPWWEQIAPFMPYERIARELTAKSVTTDDVLAAIIRRYRRARHVAWVALLSSLLAMAALVISQG